MRTVFLIALIVSLASNAYAGEKWECTGPFGSKILVIAEVMNPSTSGGVPSEGKMIVAGTTQTAVYYVQGFNRRWDFGPFQDGHYDYSFVITPSGIGRYFDFTNVKKGESVQSSMSYECWKHKRITKSDKKKNKELQKEINKLLNPK